MLPAPGTKLLWADCRMLPAAAKLRHSQGGEDCLSMLQATFFPWKFNILLYVATQLVHEGFGSGLVGNQEQV